MLQNGTEVMSIPGCVLAAHTVTTNVDGSADETLEFTTPLTPSYGQEADQAVLTGTDGYKVSTKMNIEGGLNPLSGKKNNDRKRNMVNG